MQVSERWFNKNRERDFSLEDKEGNGRTPYLDGDVLRVFAKKTPEQLFENLQIIS